MDTEEEDQADLRTASLLAEREGAKADGMYKADGAKRWKLLSALDAMALQHRALELQLGKTSDEEWEEGGGVRDAQAVEEVDRKINVLLAQQRRQEFIPDHVITPFISDEWMIVACVVFAATVFSIGREKWLHSSDAQKQGYVQGYGLVPTLFKFPRAPGPTDGVWPPAQYQTSCIWALAAIREEPLGVWAEGGCRWKLNDTEIEELIQRIEASDDAGGPGKEDNGMLELGEITKFASIPANKEWILTLPPAACALLVPTQVKTAFEEFDVQRDGSLDRNEFSAFCASLAREHIKYLQGMALVNFQAFYGRGQQWPRNDFYVNEEEHEKDLRFAAGPAVKGMPSGLQIGLDPDRKTQEKPHMLWANGWAEDYLYFCANTHPFFGIFFCDTEHALSSEERFVMELTTIIMSFSAVYFKKQVENGNPPMGWEALEDPTIFSIVIVTMPGLLLWQILFMLFTTPGIGYVDICKSSDEAIQKAYRIRTIGGVIGWAIVILGALTCVPIFVWPNLGRLGMLLTARLSGYVIAFVIPLCKAYNPVIALGQPDPYNTGFKTQAGGLNWAYIFGMGGLGQWRIEKQKAQAIFAKCVELKYTKKGMAFPGDSMNSSGTPAPSLPSLSAGPGRKSGLCC